MAIQTVDIGQPYKYIPEIEHQELMLGPATFDQLLSAVDAIMVAKNDSASPVHAEQHGTWSTETGKRVELSREASGLTIPERIELVRYSDKGRDILDDTLRPNKAVPGKALGHIFFEKDGGDINFSGILHFLDTKEVEVNVSYAVDRWLSSSYKDEFNAFATALGLRPVWLACMLGSMGKKTHEWSPKTYMSDSMGRDLLRLLR